MDFSKINLKKFENIQRMCVNSAKKKYLNGFTYNGERYEFKADDELVSLVNYVSYRAVISYDKKRPKHKGTTVYHYIYFCVMRAIRGKYLRYLATNKITYTDNQNDIPNKPDSPDAICITDARAKYILDHFEKYGNIPAKGGSNGEKRTLILEANKRYIYNYLKTLTKKGNENDG